MEIFEDFPTMAYRAIFSCHGRRQSIMIPYEIIERIKDRSALIPEWVFTEDYAKLNASTPLRSDKQEKKYIEEINKIKIRNANKPPPTRYEMIEPLRYERKIDLE